MSTNEIKQEIKNRISKTNQIFETRLGDDFLKGLSGDIIESLEILLKKTNKYFKIYKIIAIVFSIILIVFSMLKYFDSLNWGNMNKAGLFILFTIYFLLTAFRYFKTKAYLENKIWLYGLLDRIEKS